MSFNKCSQKNVKKSSDCTFTVTDNFLAKFLLLDANQINAECMMALKIHTAEDDNDLRGVTAYVLREASPRSYPV